MKRLKRFWHKNKVLTVLVIILIICLLVIGIVSLPYFYGGSDSPYGDRLDNMKSDASKTIKNYISEFKNENEAIKDIEGKVMGRIVYVSVEYSEGISLDDAKNNINSLIEKFSDDELNDYDIQITIANGSYTLMGSKNAHGSEGVIWGNYNIKTESEV